MLHLVRVGAVGQIGRFRSADALRYERATRVILRTDRGLEVGEVVSHADAGPPDATGRAEASDPADGALLRAMTPQDDLLAERLGRHRDEAFAACQRLLADRGSTAALVDVEHLFDGRGLYFYFLGETDPIADAATAELAAAYDAEARHSRFADALETGCGPGCGTADAVNGCGGDSAGGGCASCAIAGACSTGG
ncbi:MAG: PSP1 C-terminal domain-containing protein [Planctomycetota bacterium]